MTKKTKRAVLIILALNVFLFIWTVNRWVVLYPLKNGLALFSTGLTRKCGFIDKQGRVVIPPRYVGAEDFRSNGLAHVETEDGTIGWINKKGRMVKEDGTWEDEEEIKVGEFYEGLAYIKINGKYGFINRKNQTVIKPQYDSVILGFQEGLAAVQIGEKWGFIQKNGEIAISPIYDYVGVFCEGRAYVEIDDKKIRQCIDKTGKVVFDVKHDLVGEFYDGRAVVKKNEKYGYIDRSGKEVIKLIYDTAGNFTDGLAPVEIKGKFGYINTNGRFVIPPKYKYAGSFDHGLAVVKINGKYGLINKNGSIVLKPIFDEIGEFFNGFAIVKRFWRYGYIDQKGRLVIKPRFTEANDFQDGLAIVKWGSRIGYIDQRGRIIFSRPYYDVDVTYTKNEDTETEIYYRHFSDPVVFFPLIIEYIFHHFMINLYIVLILLVYWRYKGKVFKKMDR
jgi:hypothetical protein